MIVAKDLGEEQAKAFRLADNKTAEFAEWDIESLASELIDIEDIDMDQFGFDMEAFREDGVAEDDDYDFDNVDVEAKAQRGQVWLLGEHRLMCGDSSETVDISTLLGG